MGDMDGGQGGPGSSDWIKTLEAARQMRAERQISPTAFEVACSFGLKFRNHRTGQCNPGIDAIAEATGRSASRVYEAIRELKLSRLFGVDADGNYEFRNPNSENSENVSEKSETPQTPHNVEPDPRTRSSSDPVRFFELAAECGLPGLAKLHGHFASGENAPAFVALLKTPESDLRYALTEIRKREPRFHPSSARRWIETLTSAIASKPVEPLNGSGVGPKPRQLTEFEDARASKLREEIQELEPRIGESTPIYERWKALCSELRSIEYHEACA